MKDYLVMVSIYHDLLAEETLARTNPGFRCSFAPVHRITCESVEDLYDLYSDRYGEEWGQLFRYRYLYLYAQIDNVWQRISD